MMFSRRVSHQKRSRRHTSHRRNTNLLRSQSSFIGRSSRYEHLEDRWMLSAGTLDQTFGSAGYAVSALPNSPIKGGGAVMQLQDDGKIVVGGRWRWQNEQFDFVLARYNADGSLDKIGRAHV